MLQSTVELYAPLTTKTSDGTLKKVWQYSGFGSGYWTDTDTWDDTKIWYDGYDDIVVTDVQPKSLSEAQLKQWGLSTLQQDAKVVYDFNDSPYFAIGNRVRVDGDTIYDIRGVNKWDSHQEYVCIPTQGL